MQAQHPLELLSLKSVTLKHRQGLEGLQAAVDLEHFSTTSSGWLGVMLPPDKSTYTLEEVMKAYNLHHIQWDGMYVQLLIHLSSTVCIINPPLNIKNPLPNH